MKAVLDHIHQEADDIRTFWFSPARAVQYTAGQFIQMLLQHDKPDDRGDKRWFTLSSSPTDAPLISITTKFAKTNSSSFKSTLHALKPGDEVEITDPMGDFVLPKDKSIPLVFVAGGIGITPFHSIIKDLKDTAEHRSIQFLYALHDKNEQVFDELLSGYGLNQYTLIYQETNDPKAEKGNLSGARIIELTGSVENKLIYVSGPEGMVEALQGGLQEIEVPKSQLVGDYFPNYSSI
jgi:ferredoxin-NADP reductase